MRILGIMFAGTATAARPEMAAFLRDVLGLTPAHVEGVEADIASNAQQRYTHFRAPDGHVYELVQNLTD